MVKIFLAGSIGFETAKQLWRSHSTQLERHFSRAFQKAFEAIESSQVSQKQIELADHAGSMLYWNEIRQGGLFGALWEACGQNEALPGAGCRVCLDQIPIAQEIVEICELFDINPYEAPSQGSFLILWDTEASDAKAPAIGTEIGYLTGDARRILLRDGIERYLTPPERQQKDLNERHQKRADSQTQLETIERKNRQ